ncbi:MAG: outer membrane-specific lipoprotein transporter subunit LolE [Parcubacteria bacterium OLB19]|nr:MAG: outer membrane-specific lipoprotein transporter subunit LolE [Parcubacteria bacterium OLB19]
MRTFRIGFLLGFRQIQRASIWTTTLIIFVMMLTFLNLIAVSGVLVGLIAGAEKAVRENTYGDLVISPHSEEDHILNTQTIVREISTYPEITTYSVRYNGTGELEANFKERRDLKGDADVTGVKVTGIDTQKEDTTTNLSDFIVEGEYLDPNEEGKILIGAYYLSQYAELYGDIFETVEDVHPGDTVRLTVGEISKEFTVKGIIQSKVDDTNLNTYIPEREFRRLFGRIDQNADVIAIKINNPADNIKIKESLLNSGLGDYAKIQTFEESTPKFLADIKKTFNLLGTFIGSIGLVVASITIFIIIFINALSRRRNIGILKGIGISERAIEIAYVLQATFYALAGSLLGALLTYGFLVPYFDANPIQFPFSDGILVADPIETLYKFGILFITTLIAGFLPAWLITRQNTLNSILGRK